MPAGVDEFAWIESLRPLTGGDPRALDLMDDAAIIPGRPGFDLVVTKDALVEGVHLPWGADPDIFARRLLRTNLSDLAAKAAEPFGYFLMTAFSGACDTRWRARFAAALRDDGVEFGLHLLGGDTVGTSGPVVVAATLLGWTPARGMIRRSGALPGDALMVCGFVGDGWLGLRATQGEVIDGHERLAAHYRLPRPLLQLRDALRSHAAATADISDGLLADAARIAEASGIGLRVELDSAPLSPEAAAWLSSQTDSAGALMSLVTGGDDYGLVCAVRPEKRAAFVAAVEALGVPVSRAGLFEQAPGLRVFYAGEIRAADRLGWSH
ncbi:MAG: thiamine-phosphate kinase [Caulobacteraceae bacterium]